jgi:L-ascorbate metabolism protein UlaG (beta-lactamase superfamily)
MMTSHAGGAHALLSAPLPENVLGLAWLGQAGFALRFGGRLLLIDPYLSDHLARKYAGKEFPHIRRMPPPLDFNSLRGVDCVLCSHRHSDHMDPGALPVIAKNNPSCRFVVPRAELEHARTLGISDVQLVPMNASETVELFSEVSVEAIPSAHETLKSNERSEHHFLGFIIQLPSAAESKIQNLESKIYHCGDCVVYPGLAERLRSAHIDIALLPVNGRSEFLSSRGIAGNMNFAEARQLCLDAQIPILIPHHFGMFDFNTVDPAELARGLSALDSSILQCMLPTADEYYELSLGSGV